MHHTPLTHPRPLHPRSVAQLSIFRRHCATCLVYQRCHAGTPDTLSNLKNSTAFKFLSRTFLANSKEKILLWALINFTLKKEMTSCQLVTQSLSAKPTLAQRAGRQEMSKGAVVL